MPEIFDLLDREYDDPELEPTILPVDARLSIRGRVDVLRGMLERLTSISPQKEIIHGTSFLHVSVEDDSDVVRFTATDGEQTLALETRELKVIRAGKVLLPGHKVLKILNLAPEEHVTLTVLANTATIMSGRAIWNVATLPGDRMHTIPDVSGIELRPVPRDELLKGLNMVKRALPTTGSRQSLMQVKIESGSITAADAARLLRYKLKDFPLDVSMSIPSRAVDDLMRSLRASKASHVELGVGDSHIVVKVDHDLLIASKLLMNFPNVDSLLIAPALENKNSLILNTDELRDIVKRIRISADPEYAAIALVFSKGKGDDVELTVHTRDRSGNSANEKMFAIWEGDAKPSELSVNHKYLLDLLEAYEGRLATFKVGSDAKTRLTPLFLHDKERGLTAVLQQSSLR